MEVIVLEGKEEALKKEPKKVNVGQIRIVGVDGGLEEVLGD